MEVIRIGEFNPDALKQKIEIQPIEMALLIANNKRNNFACLKRLDYLLESIKENYQAKLLDFIENLKKRFHELTKNDLLKDKKAILAKVKEETNLLKEYPELAVHTLNFSFQLLKLKHDINWLNDTVEVKKGDYFRSFLIPSYYYLLVLTETIGRDEGIRLFKKYISHFLSSQKTIESNFTTLTDTFERRKKAIQSPSDWVMVIGLLSESKYVFRNDNCLWIDVLEDLPDNEIKYCICCYGDYQNAYTYSDGNTILTMEHTIAQGDPYCSRVKHDTKYDWNLEHPKKELFDNMWEVPDNKKKK
ncbi:MAG: hypothetical protein GNW80_11870 [Asgard group archaeon]|nr:hypothetical protein [Asgard group archaeon]